MRRLQLRRSRPARRPGRRTACRRRLWVTPCGAPVRWCHAADERVQLAAQLAAPLELDVGRRRGRGVGRALVGALGPRRAQQLGHLVAVEQAGDAEEVELAARRRTASRSRTRRRRRPRGRTRRRCRARRTAPSWLLGRSLGPRCALAISSSSAANRSSSSLTGRPITWSRCGLEVGGQRQQAAARWARRSTRSRPCGGRARSGRRPARSTAASTVVVA